MAKNTDTSTSKRDTRCPPGNVTLSLVIPVYNETSRLPITISELLEPIDWGLFRVSEVIFVNDGSTDETLGRIETDRRLVEKHLGAKVKVISYQPNQGKGHAIKTGMLAASGDYILMMDADMSTPLSEVKRLQTGVRHGKPIIIGTRKSRVVRVEKEQPLVRVVMGRVYTQLAQSFLNTYVSDFTCGFKLFRRDVARDVFSRSLISRWSYDAEIMFLALRLGYRPLEVAVRWHNDLGSRVHVVRDAISSFWELLQIRYYHVTGRYHLRQRLGSGTRRNRSSERECVNVSDDESGAAD